MDVTVHLVPSAEMQALARDLVASIIQAAHALNAAIQQGTQNAIDDMTVGTRNFNAQMASIAPAPVEPPPAPPIPPPAVAPMTINPSAPENPQPGAPTFWHWTAERDRALTEDFTAGKSMPEIYARLCALPGSFGTIKGASMRAYNRGLRRAGPAALPAAWQPPTEPAEAAPAPLPPPPAAPLARPSPADKRYATYAEIEAWAARFKLRFDGGNMDAVNKLRRSMRLPDFVLDHTLEQGVA